MRLRYLAPPFVILSVAQFVFPPTGIAIHLIPFLSATFAAVIALYGVHSNRPTKARTWYRFVVVLQSMAITTLIGGLGHRNTDPVVLQAANTATLITVLIAFSFYLGLAFAMFIEKRLVLFLDVGISLLATSILVLEVFSAGETKRGLDRLTVFVDVFVLAGIVGIIGLLARLVFSPMRRNPAFHRLIASAFLVGVSQIFDQMNTDISIRLGGVIFGLGVIVGAAAALNSGMKALTLPMNLEAKGFSYPRLLFFEIALAISPIVTAINYFGANASTPRLQWIFEEIILFGAIMLRVFILWRDARQTHDDIEAELAHSRRLESTIARQSAQQRALIDLGRIALSESSSKGLSQRAIDLAVSELGITVGFMVEYTIGRDVINIEAKTTNFDIDGETIDTTDRCVLMRALEMPNDITWKQVPFHPNSQIDRKLESFDIGPGAAARIIGQNNEIFGLIAVFWQQTAQPDLDGHSLAQEGLSFIQAVANVLSIAVERRRAEESSRQTQKLEAVGKLASGIAHEINTPTQFVSDNLRFLSASFNRISQHINHVEEIREIVAEIPNALNQSLDGMSHVAEIVRAMKSFGFSDVNYPTLSDINGALLNALTVSRNEWRYIAEVNTELGDLPPVECFIGELNQVFLNLIVNAAHAIEPKVVGDGPRGMIGVSTSSNGRYVTIRISDTGVGIPSRIQHRIFEPFFTTKELGQGTGQGLAVVDNVVRRHHGTVSFDTNSNGTVFTLTLPVRHNRLVDPVDDRSNEIDEDDQNDLQQDNQDLLGSL